MPTDIENTYRPLLEACSFAARAHAGQLRKDGETPYFSHPFRVCLVVRDVFGIDDRKVLTAATLHDTVEDTTKDFDDVRQAFGDEVAGWVAALTKDKRLPEDEREASYAKQLANAPWQVHVCKLADIFDNLMDSTNTEPDQQNRTFKNSRRYLSALQPHLSQRTQRPWQMVHELLAGMESQLAPRRPHAS